MRPSKGKDARIAPLHESPSPPATGNKATTSLSGETKKAAPPSPQRAVLRCGDIWRGMYRPTVLPGRGHFVERDIRDACCDFQTRLARYQLENLERNANLQEKASRATILPTEGCLSIFCHVFIDRLLGGLLRSVPLESNEEAWFVFCDVWEWLFCQTTPFCQWKAREAATSGGLARDYSAGGVVSCEVGNESPSAAVFAAFLKSANAASSSLESSALEAASKLKWSDGECLRVQRVGLLCLLLLGYYTQPRPAETFASSSPEGGIGFSSCGDSWFEVPPPRAVRLAVRTGAALCAFSRDCFRDGVLLDAPRILKFLYAAEAFNFTAGPERAPLDFHINKYGEPLGVPKPFLLNSEMKPFHAACTRLLLLASSV